MAIDAGMFGAEGLCQLSESVIVQRSRPIDLKFVGLALVAKAGGSLHLLVVANETFIGQLILGLSFHDLPRRFDL